MRYEITPLVAALVEVLLMFKPVADGPAELTVFLAFSASRILMFGFYPSIFMKRSVVDLKNTLCDIGLSCSFDAE